MGLIDVRAAVGVPCITTCPALISRRFLTDLGIEMPDWQERLIRGHGFLIVEDRDR